MRYLIFEFELFTKISLKSHTFCIIYLSLARTYHLYVLSTYWHLPRTQPEFSFLGPTLRCMDLTQICYWMSINMSISLQLHIQLFGIVYWKSFSAYQHLHVLLLKSFICCFIPDSILEHGKISVIISILFYMTERMRDVLAILLFV